MPQGLSCPSPSYLSLQGRCSACLFDQLDGKLAQLLARLSRIEDLHISGVSEKGGGVMIFSNHDSDNWSNNTEQIKIEATLNTGC